MCRTFDIISLSDYIGFSPSMIRKMMKNKELPYHKIGRKILYDRKEIEIWWENTKVNSQEIKKEMEGD